MIRDFNIIDGITGEVYSSYVSTLTEDIIKKTLDYGKTELHNNYTLIINDCRSNIDLMITCGLIFNNIVYNICINDIKFSITKENCNLIKLLTLIFNGEIKHWEWNIDEEYY